MYKSYRFALVLFVSLVSFYLIYPTIYWYFMLPSEKKEFYLSNEYEKSIQKEEELKEYLEVLQKNVPYQYHRIKDSTGSKFILNIRPREELNEKRVLPDIKNEKFFSSLTEKIFGPEKNEELISSFKEHILKIQEIENYFNEILELKKVKRSIINLGLDLAGGTHLTIGIDKHNLITKIRNRYSNYDLIDKNEIKDILLSNGENIDESKIEINESKIKETGTKKEIIDSYILEIKNSLNDAINQAMLVIRNRVNRFGISEVKITKSLGSNIFLELPGSEKKDIEDTIENITKAGELSFQIVDDTSMDNLPSLFYSQERNYQQYIDPKYIQKQDYSFNFKPEYTSLISSKNIIISNNSNGSSLYPVEIVSEFGHNKIVGFLILKNKVEMEGKNLGNLNIGYEQNTNEPFVSFTITDQETTIHFANLTEKSIGKKLAILLDGKIQSSPQISAKIIKEGRISLSNNSPNPTEEARDLLNILKAGSLPTKLNVININRIGPSLGAENISKGVISIVVGLASVIVFMILYYRLAGVIAILGLFLNLFILISILAAFGFTLTLPGICGIVLTIGMAIDANVIIFERLKEEMKYYPIMQSIDNAYKKAFSAIFDSNLTTILAAFILSNVGSGLIKGFGFTLMWGIIASMFTSLFVTKLIFDFILYKTKIGKFII